MQLELDYISLHNPIVQVCRMILYCDTHFVLHSTHQSTRSYCILSYYCYMHLLSRLALLTTCLYTPYNVHSQGTGYTYISESATPSTKCPITAHYSCGLVCYNSNEYSCILDVHNVDTSYLVRKLPTPDTQSTSKTSTPFTQLVNDIASSNTTVYKPNTSTPLGYTSQGVIINPAHATIQQPITAANNNEDNIVVPSSTQSVGATSSSTGPGRLITFINSCPYPVYPALYQTQSPLPMNGGWTLLAGQRNTVTVAQKSNGRAWGRTGCSFGAKHCDTGDCNNGAEQCSGTTGTPNVILAEWTFGDNTDYIDLSSVDAANIPISFKPTDGTYTRGNGYYNNYYPFATTDIISQCPSELQITNSAGSVVSCRNGCGFLDDNDSCSNQREPQTSISNPQNLWHYFANPTSYMQPYGDNIATFVYNNNHGTTTYTIEFCPHESGTLTEYTPDTLPTLKQIDDAFDSLPNYIPDRDARIASAWNLLTTNKPKTYGGCTSATYQ